MLTTVHSRSFG